MVVWAISALSACLTTAGCAGGAGGSGGGGPPQASDQGLPRTDQKRGDFGPAAVVDAQPVTWEDLRPLLAEASGAEVLEEVALDRMLAQELASRGLAVSAADVERESVLLRSALERNAGATPDQAAELVQTLRRARGLGESRYAGLLRRNAMLRALIAAQAEVPDSEVRQEYDIRYGRRLRARLLTVAREDEAAAARAELAAVPEADRAQRFGAVAARISTDPSAQRGGVLSPISPADPSYPLVVRQSLAALRPGELTPVVALETGYALLLLEEELAPAGVPFEQVADAMRGEVRLRQERVLMEELARRLLDRASVAPLDPGLNWSWQTRRGAR